MHTSFVKTKINTLKILVTGKNGQLGSELQEVAKSSNHEYIFVNSTEGDITNIKQLRTLVETNKIDCLINCAAYTNVDLAEDENEKAFAVNLNGVKNIDDLAKEFHFKYIHISTDYVFNGEQSTAYLPTDKTDPIGVYGKSKRAGEEIIENSSCEALIIRTAWVYSSFGKNFVKTMLHYGSERENLNVVDDQIGSPTYAKDLAEFCDYILSHKSKIDENGTIYHFTNEGEISWATFASKIMELATIDCKINRIPSSEYPTKAKRPHYSLLDLKKSKVDFGIKIRSWDEALRECLLKIQSTSN